MLKKWVYLVPLALLALAGGVWLAQSRHAPQATEASAISGLWQLAYPDLQGHSQPLSQWRGQPLVLNFWASWCAPCREEMPDFDALRAEHRANGIEFVGIAIDNADSVARFLQRMPVSYPILIGEGAAHSLARALGNPGGALPFTLVLDRDGQVVLTHLGRLPHARLDAALREFGA